MEKKAGAKYVPSGRFNPLECFLWTLTGIVAAFVIGWIYGFISHINPIIYLNILLLIGVTLVLVQATTMMIVKGKSRNKLVNFIMAVIVAIVAWYVSWCYMYTDVTGVNIFTILSSPAEIFSFIYEYINVVQIHVGRSGSGNGSALPVAVLYAVYIIEFIAFMAAPIIALSIKNYYCEDCQESLKDKIYFLKHTAFVGEHITDALSGNFEFVTQTKHASTIEELDLEELVAYKFEFHYCENCNTGSIANLSYLTLKIKDGKLSVHSNKSIVKDIYITDASTQALLNSDMQPVSTGDEVSIDEINQPA